MNKRESKKLKASVIWGRYCGVPQCDSTDVTGVSMHQIPRKVMENKKELAKWKCALKLGKELPKRFIICSKHFSRKHLLIPIERDNVQHKVRLTGNAFPTENLPTIGSNGKRRTRRKLSDSFQNEEAEMNPLCESIDAQSISELVKLPFNLDDSDNKLNAMTGIQNFMLLQKLIDMCLMTRPAEKTYTNLKNLIILTMFQIKTNVTNEQVALLFGLNEEMAQTYFTDCVKLLAKALKPNIYWQTREQNIKNLPKCFQHFSNTMTVLQCITIKSVQFRCFTCRTCNNSRCNRMKLLIGASPSGHINFISTSTIDQTQDKSIFNLNDLLKNLKQSDLVMVDKRFEFCNDLEEAGIEVIDDERDRRIQAACVHVETRIFRIKTFKMLSEKICLSMLPYLDDIITIICSISNLSLPIFEDNKLVSL